MLIIAVRAVVMNRAEVQGTWRYFPLSGFAGGLLMRRFVT
jgi:hypothetical protein